MRECELILNRSGLQLELSSDQLEQQRICEKNCFEMADRNDGTTCAHFFSVDQKLRIVRTRAEASESNDTSKHES